MANVRQITVHELKAMIDTSAAFQLWDIRTEAERRIARIEGARWLNQEGLDYLDELDRATPLTFLCHHGVRSQAAAQRFAGMGFTDVSNVVGGIEAWSVGIDAAVPRY